MDEKNEYAEMLEIPVETSTVKVKNTKKRKTKKKAEAPSSPEEAKQLVIEKVNGEATSEGGEDDSVKEQSAVIRQKKKKGKGGIFFGVSFAAVCLVLTAVIVTGVITPNSGINGILRSVFNMGVEPAVDDRVYKDFAPVLSEKYGNAAVENGVITLAYSGSIYSPLNGKVESVTLNQDNTYSIAVKHNDNFKTVISGLTYTYFNQGEEVFANIPVGYAKTAGTTICFTGEDDAVIVNFIIDDYAVVWEA